MGRAACLLLILALSELTSVGYVGSLFRQGVDLAQALEAVRGAGLRAEVESLEDLGLSVEALAVEVGRWEDGSPVVAYLVPGRSYTLLVAQTTPGGGEGTLRIALSALAAAGVLDPSLEGPTVYGAGWLVPPAPLREWSVAELGVDPGRAPVKRGRWTLYVESPPRRRAAVVANWIDGNLSYELVREELEPLGFSVRLYGPGEAGRALIENYVTVFLGGHRAPETGPAVWPWLSDEEREELESGGVVVSVRGAAGRVVVVAAGADRTLTAEAAGMVRDALKRVEALGGEGGLVEILNSSASCLMGEPGLEAEVRGGYVLATFREVAGNPCYRHELAGYRVEERSISIELSLEMVSLEELEEEYGPPGPDLFCIQCLATVQTELSIGPLEPGVWEIAVNGESVTVEVPG